MYRVEEVYKTAGVPAYTFVKPPNYTEIMIDFRSNNKPVIIEGQSGTGKTTVAKSIISELWSSARPEIFSGRRTCASDISSILSDPASHPIIILDDFHRFDESIRTRVGDLVKTYAEDDSSVGSKIIIIGINKCGSSLIQLVPDVAKRVGIHKIKPATPEQTFELIQKGESKLNIDISQADKQRIHSEAEGDYWLVQNLCQKFCLLNSVTETLSETRQITLNLATIRDALVADLSERYKTAIVVFCRGRRFRQSNRPYLRLLRAIADSGKSTVNLDVLSSEDPKIKPSVDQIKKTRLKDFINNEEGLQTYFFYDATPVIFSIEDPAVSYYIKHLDWENLRKDAGFTQEDTPYRYDVAFSFAGTNRDLVEYIKNELESADTSTFYDRDFEAKLLGADLESEFKNAFLKESRFVVVFIDAEYASRLWPRFEVTCFASRVGSGAVIPVKLDATDVVEIPSTIGRIPFTWNKNENWQERAKTEIVNRILEKLKS